MLTEKQQIVLDCLLAGDNGQQAAEKADTTKQQVSRWRKLPEFAAALQAKQEDILDRIQSGIDTLTPKALRRLDKLMASGNATIQFRTSTFVIDKAIELRQVRDQEERIAALEAELAKSDSQTGPAGTPGQAETVPLGGPPTGDSQPVGRPDEPDEGSRLTA